MKKLTIATIASEVSPFTKTGGLADVAGSLPLALHEAGHKNIIITPLYFDSLIEKHKLKKIDGQFRLFYQGKSLDSFAVYWTEITSGVPVYFIQNNKYIQRKKRIYDASRDNQTFFYFNNAALTILKEFRLTPDILHCHDWHTGLVPYLARTRLEYKNIFACSASVFTIHNLSFQMGGTWWAVPQSERDDGRYVIPSIDTKDILNVNFAKRGIMYADIISTVSEQYAEEILTKDFGEDLQRILRNRSKRLFGIVNGIDYKQYNPKTDPGLYQNYSIDSLHQKAQNKIQFQHEVSLPETTNPPMIALTSRVSEQKGFDLIMEIIDPVLRLGAQLIILGEGEKRYENFFTKLKKKNPKKIYTQFHFDPIKETQILAAADMMLLPSRFEPCGIGQLKSLRYGCIPIVRKIGGLADTITDYNPVLKKGNGFTFGPYDSRDLLVAIARAIENFRHRDEWQELVYKAMRQSFSWDVPAMKYVKLFRKAIKLRKNKNNNDKS